MKTFKYFKDALLTLTTECVVNQKKDLKRGIITINVFSQKVSQDLNFDEPINSL